MSVCKAVYPELKPYKFLPGTASHRLELDIYGNVVINCVIVVLFTIAGWGYVDFSAAIDCSFNSMRGFFFNFLDTLAGAWGSFRY
jgi:hypothetical protein